jgi:hypothetical protein
MFTIAITLLFFVHHQFKALKLKPLFLNDLNFSDELKAYLADVGSSTHDFLTLSLLERATLYNQMIGE